MHPILICDFCSSSEVRWSYPARTFDAVMALGGENQAFVGQSVGDWAACSECHALIERGDRDALAKRTIETGFDVPDADRACVAAIVRSLHARFFEARCGDARRVAD